MDTFTFDELDELLNYARFEADAAAHTACTNDSPLDRDLAHQRWANATYLERRLLKARGHGGERPSEYLLKGAESYCYASVRRHAYQPGEHMPEHIQLRVVERAG